MQDTMIIVRGGGDIATGVIHRLFRSGYQVLILETEMPTAIRRKIAFSEAAYDGTAEVEGVVCRKITQAEVCRRVWASGEIPLLTDAAGLAIEQLHPEVVVDAILAKENLGTQRDSAPLTVALGPGFYAGRDVDYVIETMRGHNLGRIIMQGTAQPNTGVPGMVGGYAAERVIHAQAEGSIRPAAQIGDLVHRGETLAWIGETPVKASLTGILRGMIREGFPVTAGLKIADIDPRREQRENCDLISDKARCIAGSVLELVSAWEHNCL